LVKLLFIFREGVNWVKVYQFLTASVVNYTFFGFVASAPLLGSSSDTYQYEK